MSVHKRKQDGRWFTVFIDESGKQRKKIFGPGPEGKKEAEAFDYRLKADKKEGIKPVVRSKVYLDDLTQRYLDERRSMENVSQHYVYSLKLLMNGYILPVLNHKPVDELTYQDVLKVAEIFKDRKQATRNRYFGYLRAIFRYGVRFGITKSNPLSQWKKTTEPLHPSKLTVDDVRKIIACAPDHLKWGMQVEWNLGCRPGPSELFSIRWQDVDFDKPCVKVYATKTKKWRDIPIKQEFRDMLLDRRKLAQTEFLIEYKGKPVKRFRRSFQTAVKNAGISVAARMYDLRHLFITVMMAGGAELAAVSQLAGHSSKHMTADVYLDGLKGEKERAISLLPSITSNEAKEAVSNIESPTAPGKVIPFRPRQRVAV